METMIVVWYTGIVPRQIPASICVSPINRGFVHACTNSMQTHGIIVHVRVENEW